MADAQKDTATGTASLQALVLQLTPNAKMGAMVVPPDPAEPAEASKLAACEPNCGHHRPVRLNWGSRTFRACMDPTPFASPTR